MITEVAILHVRSGQGKSFEEDFREAGAYISKARGYLGHSLKKCIEKHDQYILIVNWESVEDHEQGFRRSSDYLKWKSLLHPYYEPFPEVLHYEDIIPFESP